MIAKLPGVTTNDTWEPGRLIRDARTARGISLREAGRRAGFSETWVRRIEAGLQIQDGEEVQVNPSAARLATLSDAVGADTHAVLIAAGYNPEEEMQDHRLRITLGAISTELSGGPLADLVDIARILQRRQRQ